MPSAADLEDEIVAAVRRIVRAIDLHSRTLMQQVGLTGPQLATLRAAQRLGTASTGALARAVQLSQPTVSGILDRLERQELVHRERSESDRRSVVITITAKGERALDAAPSLLQDRFVHELQRLADWEQHQLLSVLQRIASMMAAEELDASPHLETGSLSPTSGPGGDLSDPGPSADA